MVPSLRLIVLVDDGEVPQIGEEARDLGQIKRHPCDCQLSEAFAITTEIWTFRTCAQRRDEFIPLRFDYCAVRESELKKESVPFEVEEAVSGGFNHTRTT